MAKIYGQLEVAQLHNKTSDPSSPPAGLVIWRTDTNLAKIATGSGSTYKTLVDTDSTQTLTNKTLTSPVLTTPTIASFVSNSVTFTMPTADGTSGQVLKTNGSGVLSFVTALTDPMTTRGDIIIRDSSNATARLGIGAANKLLYSDGTDISWHYLKGTTTNDSAAAGDVGERVVSSQTTSTNFPTSGNYGDVASISLTAGDWDITAAVLANLNSSTLTGFNVGIGTVSGNDSTGLTEGDNFFTQTPPTSSADATVTIPTYRVSIASTTTYYLKLRGSYASGTPRYKGRISARRVR